MKVFSLTEEYNAYFIEVFKDKPTKQQLIDLIQEDRLDHLLAGGGRIGYEDHWYNLEERELK